ncbi:MAG: glutamine-hydrolyzing GMP synthase [Candidatus Oxydemutatoraceae bacterium WSBS_2016_MAG_OTU14]
MSRYSPMAIERVLIVDFGSQYTQLIARRVRELNVYSEIYPWSKITTEFLQDFSPRCIILSGGPESTHEAYAPEVHEAIYTQGVPLLGICYGMQAMASQLGGTVEMVSKREFGSTLIKHDKLSSLFAGVPEQCTVWMSHGDQVTQAPQGFEVVARSDNSEIAAMVDSVRHFYALQFHPEVTHSQGGKQILHNFVIEIAQCAQTWQASAIIATAIEEVQQQVGSHEEVVLGLSGGVDSSVTAALLQRALGKRLHCVFVDTGLLRRDEAKQVVETFKDELQIDLIHVEAAKKFYAELAGVTDPEQKRKVIGRLFVEIFEQQAKQLGSVQWLAQGTIYPDRIESAGVNTAAHLIKSHHNVGGLPEKMDLKILEPLGYLFKDEVRMIGTELGLPDTLTKRHPFPGPGLAVRILGEVKAEYVDILQHVDDIFIKELHSAGLYYDIGQAFAVFLPVKSVGVKGDCREYSYVVVLRAVETQDFMTANIVRFPHEFLERVSARIINEVPNISRVCYDISSKPPATIEWE